MNAWQEYGSHEMNSSKELDADFNFPKIQLISNWAKLICWYRSLPEYCAKTYQQAHKTNLKDGWNASNHDLNYLPQVITFQRRILYFYIRELNVQALAQCLENSAATFKVFPSSADLGDSLSSHSYAKPKLIGRQNLHDGMHHDAMINDFRALLDNRHDATHYMAIYPGTREFIKYKCRNKTYVSDEQLHSMELCLYHGIRIHVDGLDGELISWMCQCTASETWSGGDRRNDRVWVKQRLGGGMACWTSATTGVSVWNTRVFRTALTALTEPSTLWRRITRYPSPRRRVAFHSRVPGSAGDKLGSLWEHFKSQ